jgi:hypothetical protein
MILLFFSQFDISFLKAFLMIAVSIILLSLFIACKIDKKYLKQRLNQSKNRSNPGKQ